MKKDIIDATDISNLVNTFYNKVFDDKILNFVFSNAPGFSFEEHIPTMISFWETLLFGTASYKGNPMIKHIELNRLIPLSSHHFSQWLAIWETTVKENFAGKYASMAIAKAKNIAGIMERKINSAGMRMGL